MFGMREMCECPICGRQYDTNPGKCDCGFEGLVFLPMYATDEVREKYEGKMKELDFRIYKFAKKVYYGEIPYERSKLVSFRREGRIDIDEALERRGLAVVDSIEEQVNGLPTVALEGMLAMRTNVCALILNTDEAEYSMLDESRVRILLLGANFKGFCHGGLLQYGLLRYLWVDGKSKHFVADDNVLFSKDQTRLYLYARSRPGEEYRVPPSVKSLEPYSFFQPRYLKRLYLPKGIRVSKDALQISNAYVRNDDGELVKTQPEFDVIYY